MSSIDPIRTPPVVRRRKSVAEAMDELEGKAPVDGTNLPVPVSPAQTLSSKSHHGGKAAIDAQLMGERRGLRAGPGVHDEAKGSYVKTEYSGSWDRRRPKGRAAKKEI